MIKRLVTKVSTVGATVLSSALLLSAGPVAAMPGVGWSGPGSQNHSMTDLSSLMSKYNTNGVDLQSHNLQGAKSGGSGSNFNTVAGGYGNGGDTGSVHNNANNSTSVSVSNGGGGFDWLFWYLHQHNNSASGIALTGPGSVNLVSTRVTNNYQRNNFNMVGVSNMNDQSAYSGSSNNDFNTLSFGGGGRTGSATNNGNNSASVSLNNGGGGSGPMMVYGNGGVSGGGIWLTGPGSTNQVTREVSNDFSSTNVNGVTVANHNNQTAASGNSNSSFNTVAGGGGGSTGSANNNGNNGANVDINNASSSKATVWDGGASGSGSIGITGPGSFNSVSTVVNNSHTENNTNIVDVHNMNDQAAQSGDSSSVGNTIGGGSGQTGPATNNGSNGASVSIKN